MPTSATGCGSSTQLLRDEPKLLPGFHSWLELVRHAQRDNQSRIFQRELIRAATAVASRRRSTQLVQQGEREYLIAVSRDNREPGTGGAPAAPCRSWTG